MVGEQCGGRRAGLACHLGNRFGKLPGFLRCGHKSAAAGLDIHHQGIEAAGELLAEDGAYDQG
jgi:hypothetical protein